MKIRVVAGAALMLAGAGVALSGGVAGGQVSLVTDYANYPDTPQAQLTPGCDANGDVEGVLFSVGGGASVGSLAALPEVAAGDVLTMTWTGVSADCVGSAVSLTIKAAQTPVFDSSLDQFTAGSISTTLADGPGSLSLTLPDLASFGFACAYQLDAIVGLPLAVVGPSGSDYSASVRGDTKRTTVFSWRNSAYSECEEATTTTTTPSTTSTSTPSSTTSTSEAPTTSTTTVASTTTEPSSLTVFAPQPQAPGAMRTLAATGPSHNWMPAVGAVLLTLGAWLVWTTRRLQRA